MVVIETNRICVIYYRTNRRTRWEYAEYAGRYASPAEAVKELKRRLVGQPAEYLIHNMATDEEVIGTI